MRMQLDTYKPDRRCWLSVCEGKLQGKVKVSIAADTLFIVADKKSEIDLTLKTLANCPAWDVTNHLVSFVVDEYETGKVIGCHLAQG